MPPVPKPRSAKSSRSRTLLIAIGAAAVVAAALIVGSVVLTGGGSSSSSSSATTTTAAGAKPAALALIAGIPQNGTILGKPSAQLRMLQYEDLQCPICKRYTDDAFPSVVNEYVKPGRLQLDFRGLAFLGPDSEKALRVALAAGKQNKLWDVVGLFYEDQGEENSGWVTDALIDEILGRGAGPRRREGQGGRQSAAVTNEIAASPTRRRRIGVQGTPGSSSRGGVNQPFPIRLALAARASSVRRSTQALEEMSGPPPDAARLVLAGAALALVAAGRRRPRRGRRLSTDSTAGTVLGAEERHGDADPVRGSRLQPLQDLHEGRIPHDRPTTTSSPAS